MKTFQIGFLAAVVILSLATGASAQATRTWVSGVGDDANPCSRTAPCKTWAGAISKTAAGGEIDALDPGGYGAVTITKAITLDGGGMVASGLVSGTNDFVINAGASDVVTLRRIQANGLGTGLNGVHVLLAKAVIIEDCDIFGFTTRGVNFASTANPTSLFITNSRITNNPGGGIVINSGNVMIVSTHIVANGGAGLDVVASGGGPAPVVRISESTVMMNFPGIRAGSGGTIRMSHLDVFGLGAPTTEPWSISGTGVIETYLDNRISGTGTGALTRVTTP